jgi:hypothetical protein
MGNIPDVEQRDLWGVLTSSRAYLLDIRRSGSPVPVGFLYVSRDVYTFAWDGALDFSNIEHEALDSLPNHLLPGAVPLSPENPATRFATEVSLILAGESDELVKYNLGNPQGYSGYKEILQNPARISFARYDVQGTWGGPQYSFTAENPNYLPTNDSELAVRLFRSTPFPPALYDWILDHHSYHSELKKELEAQATVELFQHLIGF